jgi:predicted RNA-binding protein Jag
VHAVRGNTYSQVYEAIRQMFGSSNGSIEEFALRQVEDAIAQIAHSNAPMELLPQNAYIRRLQHEMAARHNLRSGSVGKEPRRRVMIYPD